MDNLYKIQDLVHKVLEEHPKARNNDDVLYIKVCEKVNPEALNKPFWFVHANLKGFNYPKFESVRRSRQKLQAEYPELAADADVEAGRMVNEEAFKEFAKGWT